MVTLEELKARQSLSLRDKVRLSQVRIEEWYETYQGKVYVAFSGGKDSTVLLHLVRTMYPDIPAVFCDTGLEFPEIKSFVRETKNVTWLRPKMSFVEVLKKYGYPVVSKRQAQYIHQVQTTKSEVLKKLRLTGIRRTGKFSQMSKISNKWQFLVSAPFKISDRCCYIMKKHPANAYSRGTGRMPIIGKMASESKGREKDWLLYGCNAFDLKQPTSNPMSFWNDKDVWSYIKKYNVPYSKIYDMGYQRTGCVFCPLGCHLEERETGTNQFILLRRTHPKLWRYCMDNLGMRDVLSYVGIRAEDRQLVLPFVERIYR